MRRYRSPNPLESIPLGSGGRAALDAPNHRAPGPQPQYGESYYRCFLRDLDGHNIEAAFWDFELAAKLGTG